MLVINSPKTFQKKIIALKRKGKSIAVVPTMGYLHEGHLTLLRKARKKCDVVILTLFVNPTQFGKNEDLSKYPRDEKGDLQKAKSVGTDLVFMPTPEMMYEGDFQTSVECSNTTQELCGKSRPTHFKGVTTVVAKLFNITLPDFAFFGMKDFQQLATIKQMVKDLNFPIAIIGVPTVREKDGLAMSSRNVYLNQEERKAALILCRTLNEIKNKVSNTKITELMSYARQQIESEPLARIDYLECMHAETIQPLIEYIPKKTLFATAVFIGKTRLIDNIVI